MSALIRFVGPTVLGLATAGAAVGLPTKDLFGSTVDINHWDDYFKDSFENQSKFFLRKAFQGELYNGTVAEIEDNVIDYRDNRNDKAVETKLAIAGELGNAAAWGGGTGLLTGLGLTLASAVLPISWPVIILGTALVGGGFLATKGVKAANLALIDKEISKAENNPLSTERSVISQAIYKAIQQTSPEDAITPATLSQYSAVELNDIMHRYGDNAIQAMLRSIKNAAETSVPGDASGPVTSFLYNIAYPFLGKTAEFALAVTA